MAFPSLTAIHTFYGPFSFVEIEYEFGGLKITPVFVVHLFRARVEYVSKSSNITCWANMVRHHINTKQAGGWSSRQGARARDLAGARARQGARIVLEI